MKNISVTALTSNKEVLESARITVWKEAIDLDHRMLKKIQFI